jgi:AraC-like DNA-binding protein
MVNLLSAIENTINENNDLPFAVYSSIKEQNLLNVPIVKPLLIIVLNGDKKLGLGLHLLQTTLHSIVLIAEKCGYQSQSRFTDRFKGRFGLTPSELRKTKMVD